MKKRSHDSNKLALILVLSVGINFNPDVDLLIRLLRGR